ncbi:Retrotransposon-like protein 1 [Anabarilius grahami]|uniref:Retrotransposon-like protein 1 n=1 Tax=Anabarilius grahami TaxID=495550 RepID=A0A3N0XY59_ANAGA|nr:Retrotransposon-like protein 1 [Anabarilius grahami]
MSQPDPFQALVDALRRTLTTNPPSPPPTVTSPSPAPAVTTVNTIISPSPPVYASPMAKPAPYSGSAEDCSGFLLQCELVLEMQLHLYPNDTAKISFLISQLSGKALKWADSIWSQHGAVTQMLAAVSGWNEQALITTYRQGLEPQVRLHLTAYEDSIGLEKFIQLSIRCATRMHACLQEHQGQSLPNSLLCRSKPKLKPLTTIVNLTAADISLTVVALLDSGSAGNFISSALCRQLQLKTSPSRTIYQINSITGKPLSRKQVRYVVGPIKLRVGLFHLEEIHLLVLEDSTADVVLGRPWLEQHSPTISWKTGEILKWDETCFSQCFSELPIP